MIPVFRVGVPLKNFTDIAYVVRKMNDRTPILSCTVNRAFKTIVFTDAHNGSWNLAEDWSDKEFDLQEIGNMLVSSRLFRRENETERQHETSIYSRLAEYDDRDIEFRTVAGDLKLLAEQINLATAPIPTGKTTSRNPRSAHANKRDPRWFSRMRLNPSEF